jgi:hypothetical protein
VVVSEESSTISLASQSRLWSNLSPTQLRERIAGPLDREEPSPLGVSA